MDSQKQKNVSRLLRLRYLRYRQTPVLLKRVRAHALGREPSTLLLIDSNFGEFGEQELKLSLQRIFLFFVFAMSP